MNEAKDNEARRVLKLVRHAPDGYWQNVAAKQKLGLFHCAAARVPAYRNFLLRFI